MYETNHGRILIVEDDLGTALLQRRCLERRGFSAVNTATTDEAMEVVRAGDVQLIVSDYRLSERTTGLDFCEQLKRSGSTVPVVLVTGFSQESTAIEALRAGVRDYVNKSPDYLDYLPDSVDRILKQVGVERKLAESEARLAAIINCSQDAIVAVDEEQNITLFNPAAEDIFGFHVTEALGMSIKRLIPEELAWAPTWGPGQLASLTAAGARVPRIQADGVRSDGTLVPLEITVSHVAACGRIFSTLVIRDITLRKQADEALRASEERFRRFMDNSPAVALIKDEAGRYVYLNRMFEQLFELPLSEAIGKTDRHLFTSAVAEQLQENDRAVFAANRVLEFSEAMPTPDGVGRCWMTFKFPFENMAEQRLIGGVAIDVTKHKQAEESLRQRDEQLRRAQRMEAIGTLTGGIAHEFSNFIQTIHGYVKLARQALPADEQPYQDLEQAMKAADQAAALTRQLLGFGRRQLLQFADVELNRFVEDFVGMMRPLIGTQINLAVNLARPLGTVYADFGQLQQVLMNLCLNARDAMPNGGTLLLGTESRLIEEQTIPDQLDLKPGPYLVLTVRDTGCGISENVKEHIFDPFFTTKEIGKGTGLGLAMVYGIVQGHHGTIHVQSEPGLGTTFEIFLPAGMHEAPGEARTDVPMDGGAICRDGPK